MPRIELNWVQVEILFSSAQSDLSEEVKKRNQAGKKVEDLYSKIRGLEQEKKELKSMVVELENCFQKIHQESIEYDRVFPEWIE